MILKLIGKEISDFPPAVFKMKFNHTVREDGAWEESERLTLKYKKRKVVMSSFCLQVLYSNVS